MEFGSLVVKAETAKIKSANIIIISSPTHNDIMHAVTLLAPAGAPIRKL